LYTLIKVDWLAAWIALRVFGGVLVVFLRSWRPPANGKQGLIPEEMSQTLLTNRSKETWTKYTPTTLANVNSHQPKEMGHFCVIKSFEQLKNFKKMAPSPN
jgi:hypothetical protein